MRQVILASETDWGGWRQATRALILAGAEPETLDWHVGGQPDPLPEATGRFTVPRRLVDLASLAIQARAAGRFALLYRLVWQATKGLLEDESDFAQARALALAVRAEAHRMRSHLRFMPVRDAGGERFLGWYQPAHFVLEANAQLIARRFPESRFSIITPDGSAHWDGTILTLGAPTRQMQDDAMLAAWWDAHHAALLAEARPGTAIPEAEALDEAPRPPDRPSLGAVVLPLAADPAMLAASHEAMACQRCGLHAPATQTVFGEGPAGARIMFVGEQPGDHEDVIGRPFVGPAGQLLDQAMEQAGIDRRTIYITNAVKHFKFSPRGKRRIHQSPDPEEIRICGFWLDVERVQLAPRLLVLMGGSGARAVLGRPVAVTRERGRPFRLEDGQTAFITVHPSYLLRIPNEADRAREYRAFVEDLRAVQALIAAG
jgi:DNA polymerase